MRSVGRTARLTCTAAYLAVGLASGSCIPWKSGPEPVVTSLVVRNRSFFDVNVYVLPSIGGPATRMGTVVGTSTSTFPLHSLDLQTGGVLVVRVRAIGANSIWTSESVAVDPGVIAVLDVYTNAFGDCSTSSLHTIIALDSIPGTSH